MKVVYDTCLYIDLLRDSKRIDLFQRQNHVRFLSPIVILELNAGVRSSKQQAILDRLYNPYSKAGRIIRLENEHYNLAGKILGKIRDPSHVRKITNDVLIATAAYSLGAWLFTSNKKDFEIIQKFLKIKLEFV